MSNRRAFQIAVIAILIGMPLLARAATTDFRIFFDLDNDAATGCTVSGMPGVDQILITQVMREATTANVASTSHQTCTAGILGPVTPLETGGWPAGFHPESGQLLVETRIPFALLGSGTPHNMRIGVEAKQGSATHLALTLPDGSSVLFPALPGRRRAVGVPGSDRMIVLDGASADWAGLTPLFPGIASGGSNVLRITNVYGFASVLDDQVYFRFDATITTDGPVAIDDDYPRELGSGLIKPAPGVLVNDFDPASLPLTATPLSDASHGSVVLNPDGSFTYTPDNPASNVSDSFKYKATNGVKESNPATVTIHVSNLPPTASDAAFSVPENSPNGTSVGTVTASDPDGDTLTYSITAGNTGVAFAINAATGAITVANSAALDFETTPAFVLTVTVSDGPESDTATITINLTNVNEAPVAASDAYATNEDTALNVAAPGVLSNDTDPDVPHTLTAVLVSGPSNAQSFGLNADGSFSYTPSANFNGSDSFTYQADDGALQSNTATVTITVNPVNDPPSFTSGGDVSSPEDTPYSATWATAISAGPADEAGQTLTFNITANDNTALFSVQPAIASNGTLTFTPALDANGVANLTVTLSDNGGGASTSAPASFMITITPVNDAPVLVAGGGSPTFTEDGPPVAVDPGILVSDIDDTNLESASVTITNLLDGGMETLAASTGGTSIVANYVAPTLALTGTDTLANYQMVLRSVTYANASQDPNPAARSISFVANDGDVNSNTVATGVNIAPVNDAPVLTAGGTLNYTENDPATAIDTTITITDVDSATLAGATVQITGNYANGQDVLSYVPALGITGVFSAGSGTLTLSGTATLADYQTALRNVLYQNTSDDPSTSARTVTWQVDDGGAVDNLSNQPTSTINVAAVDDAPTLAAGSTVTYTENDAPLTLEPALTITDPDSTMMQSAIVSISGNPELGKDVLACPACGTTVPGISAVYNGGSGVLTLSGNDTLANYQTALRSVTFASTSENPSTSQRTIDWFVTDDTALLSQDDLQNDTLVDVISVNDEPSFTSGGDVLGDSTPGTQVTFNGWATGISAGPPDESGQTIDFVIDNVTNSGNFTVQPAVDASGNLTFTPVAGVQGTSTVTLHIHDDGGTADGGDDASPTQSFVITLDASPSVSSTTPANGATDQSASTNVSVTFSEPVNATGASFTISCATSGAHAFALSGGPTTWTLDPTVDFTQGETCMVTVVAAQVTDADTNDGPDGMLADYVFSFSIDAAPSVTTTTPANGAITIATNTDLTVDFSEAVTITNASVTIACATSGAHTVTVSGGPTNWTVNPDTDFAPNELCTVTVLANQVSDNDSNDPPDNMVANYVFSFTTDAAPSVILTSPANGSTTTPDTDIDITFDEPVNVTGSWFTINCTSTGAHTATVTGGPTTFTLNPDVDFTGGETCTVTIVAAQVDDQDAGDPPANPLADYVFSFDVDAAPTVVSTTPANGAIGVPSNADVTIDFSESVNASLSSFTISCNVSGAHAFAIGASPASTFVLDPTVDFTQAETCTVTVLAAQVTDADANDPPDNMAANYVFSFTIDAAPTVVSTTPSNGATDQSASTNIGVTFSEPVNAAGASFTISCDVSGAHVFGLSGGPTTWTLDPTVDFTEGETCTVTALAAQVTDVDANDPPDNMLADSVFSFTIDAAPSVVSTTPADTATGVATNSDITLDFSESVSLTASPVTISCVTSGAHTFSVSASPNTSFTVNPTADFAPGELCTVTVLANQVTDSDTSDPPDNMTSNYVFTFTTDFAPEVSSTTPNNGDIVDPASNIDITFSEAVDVTGSWFTINCGTTGSHTATVTGGPVTFTLNPDSDFVGGEVCTVTIVAAQVTDQDANDPPNNMLADYVFSFTVDAAPTVTATSPTNGATGVPTNTAIQITYDEAVNATGSAYSIECPAPGNLQTFVLGGNGTAIHTLTPSVNLPAGTTCTVTALAAEITDADTNDPPDNLAANYVFSFTTDAAPSVTATTPTNGATDIPTNTNLTIDFSESVSLASVTISCATSGAHTSVISGSPGTSITANPDADFSPNELCTVTVVAGQVSDTDPNDPPDNMAANYVFSFTTDAAPSVTSTTPANGATDIPTNTNLTIDFSESVSLASVTISCAASGAHTSVISGSPGTSITVNPDADFSPNEVCTVTIVANQVSDTDTNDPPDNMAANYVFSFTTDAAPSVTSTTPANAATGVSRSTNIDITFSEAVNVAGNWFQIVCGAQTKNVSDTAVTGGPTTFTINPTTDLLAGENCSVTVFAAQVTDQDSNDPPDNMLGNYVFTFAVPPVAMDDTYGSAILGNVPMNTANSTNFSILTNDVPTSGVTINTSGTTTQGGTIVMAADGKFSYNPPAGYEGADSFTYTNTAGNGSGTSASPTDKLTVTGMVWFINNAAGAGDGRLGTPFNSIGSFAALNDGVGNHPAANDVIFVYESGVGYAGNLTLLNGQRLLGQDHTTGSITSLGGVTLGPDNSALPAMNTGAPITLYGSTLTLGQNNQLHGFSHFPSVAEAIIGTSFGTLTVSEVFLNNSAGRALNLATGTLSANFGGIVSTNSGTNGVTLTSVDGSLTIGNSGTSSNSTGSLVAIGGGNVGITWGNNLSQANNAALLDISGGHTGTINFNGNITATNGTGLQFNNADGTYNFNGATQSLNGGDAGVDIVGGSAGSFTFSNFFLIGNTTSPTGTVFNVNTSTPSVTYSGNMTQTNNAALVSVSEHASGTLTFQTGTLSATNGAGLSFSNADGTYNFNGTTTLNGGNASITIQQGGDATNGSQGTFVFGSATTITNPAVTVINIGSSKPTFTYSGSFSKTSAAVGINAVNNQGGSITINGTGTKSLSTSVSNAIFLDNNDNCTISFSGNNLSVTTTSGAGFTATNGGTVTVTGTGNTISTGSGNAVNVANTTIGGGGITFQSVSHNGNNNGIILNTTGAGAFTISGTGLAGSGGTLQNTVGADAVVLNTTGGAIALNHMIIQDITSGGDAGDANDTHSGVDAIHGRNVNGGLTLNNVTIQRISDSAINGTTDAAPVTLPPTQTVWNGLTITNCTFANTNRFNVANRGDGNNEGAIYILGIKGTVSVTGSAFSSAGNGMVLWTDTSGTLDLTVRSNTFTTLYKEIGTLSVGNFGIDVVQQGTLTSLVRIGDTVSETNAALGNTFTNGGDRAAIRVIANTGATGAMKSSIAKNTFTVTDHSSAGTAGGSSSYNFPQSGVLLRTLANVNYEAIFAANTFNECMHADGGLGNLSIILESGNSEVIVRNNTFSLPWDAPIELRADGNSGTQSSALVQFSGNQYPDGIVGSGSTDIGGQSPYEAFYAQVRNNGRMNLTIQNEGPFGLTDTGSAFGTNSFYANTTSAGDILSLFLQNTASPRGYRLTASAGTTYNLFRNGSASGTAQLVLQDNGNTGGGGVDGTTPPTVSAPGAGTITLSNTAPTLPVISPP